MNDARSIDLAKHDHAARTHEPRYEPQHRHRVRTEHQNVSADHRVELLVVLQTFQVPLPKRDVLLSERIDPLLRG